MNGGPVGGTLGAVIYYILFSSLGLILFVGCTCYGCGVEPRLYAWLLNYGVIGGYLVASLTKESNRYGMLKISIFLNFYLSVLLIPNIPWEALENVNFWIFFIITLIPILPIYLDILRFPKEWRGEEFEPMFYVLSSTPIISFLILEGIFSLFHPHHDVPAMPGFILYLVYLLLTTLLFYAGEGRTR